MRLIPRDFSSWPPVPGPLWTIATGRFPTSPLRIRPEFPFAPLLEPLFLGFSAVGSSDLEETAADYLRVEGADRLLRRATVRILRKADIKAFYSGAWSRRCPSHGDGLPVWSQTDVAGVGPAERDSLAAHASRGGRMPARDRW